MSGPGGGTGISITVGAVTGGAVSGIAAVVSMLQDLRDQLMAVSSAHASMGASVSTNAPLLDGFNGILERGVGILRNWASMATSVATGMIAFSIFNDAAGWVKNLGDEMMSLSETMQQQQVGWSYLYGDSNGPNEGAASQLMGWSAQESYNMPYTRQDMNQAISMLQMLGLSTQGVEKYMPVLADLGVRRPGLTLTEIAQAVMGAAMGYPRMMKYELALPDTALVPYGLDINGARSIDPKTLLPALMAYSESQSYYNPQGSDPTAPGSDMGAAWALSHDSFSGAMTSWTDRYQNAMLNLGGTFAADQVGPDGKRMSDIQAQWDAVQGNLQAMTAMLAQYGGGVWVRDNLWGTKGHPDQYIQKPLGQAGDIQKGSYFDDIINGLNAITSWWDSHQVEINKITALFSNVLGQGLKDAGDALGAFLAGLKQSGAGDAMLQQVQGLLTWLGDPQHQNDIKAVAKSVGEDLGGALKNLGDIISSVSKAWDHFTSTFTSGEAQQIGNIFSGIGTAIHDVMGDDLAHGVAALGDLGALVNDIINRNWGAVPGDAGKYLQDMAQWLTFGHWDPGGSSSGSSGSSGGSTGGTSTPSAQAQQSVANATNHLLSGNGSSPSVGHAYADVVGGAFSASGGAGSGGVGGAIGGSYTNVWHISGATSLDLQRLVEESAKKQSRQIGSSWRAAGGGGALFGTVGLGI